MGVQIPPWKGAILRGKGRPIVKYMDALRELCKNNWKSLNGSMPQGSRLGPLSFIVMIDDLRAPCE